MSFVLMLLLLSSIVMQQSVSEEALVAGHAIRWGMRGRTPFEKEAERLKAVRCFRSGMSAPGSAESKSQCALRSGELLSAGGLREAARRDLTSGAALSGGEWSARCALHFGELCLEDGRGVDALSLLSSITKSKWPTKLIERSAVLSGSAFAAIGEDAAAVKLWRGVAEDGATPDCRFEAFERWGQHLLELDDLEGVAGVISQRRVSLESVALELTAAGRGAKRALSQVFTRSIS